MFPAHQLVEIGPRLHMIDRQSAFHYSSRSLDCLSRLLRCVQNLDPTRSQAHCAPLVERGWKRLA